MRRIMELLRKLWEYIKNIQVDFEDYRHYN